MTPTSFDASVVKGCAIPRTPMLKQIGFWSRLVVGTACWASLAAMIFTDDAWHWRQMLEATAANFAFSFFCSSLGFLTIPHLVPIIRRRLLT